MVNSNALSYEDYCDNEKNARKKLTEKNQKHSMVKYRYFYVFLLGGFFGTLYEEILTILVTGAWESRAGMLLLPFNPLYGFGAVGFVLVLSRFKQWYHQITYGAILGGTLEYVCSWLQEVVSGTSSWNYNNVFTNIDGRTTVVFALSWGFMGFALVQFVYPLIIKLLKNIPYKVGNIITIILICVFAFLVLLTFAALIRCNLSRNGVEPVTFIGKLLDKYLPQQYLQKCFPNMKFN